VLEEQYEKVVAAGGRIAGPAAEALLANRMDQDILDWLKTSFYKTELELGRCLRPPPKAPASAISAYAARSSSPPANTAPGCETASRSNSN
jgi:hypothetical protein